jgi:hypothetical protein
VAAILKDQYIVVPKSTQTFSERTFVQGRRRSQHRAAAWREGISWAFARARAFVLTLAAMYIACSLVGHILVELARRDAAIAAEAARSASAVELRLRRKNESLVGLGEIDLWAKRLRLVAPDRTAMTRTKTHGRIAEG